MEFVYIIIWALFWGIICQAVGSSKNINGFWWGFWLGFIGLIVVLCSKGQPDINTIDPNTNYPNEQNTNKFDQLQKLSKLKESGAITEEEFENEKKKILNN